MPGSHDTRIGTTTIRAQTGDITRQEVDAVVNAANDRLQHGGGVAAAIARAGGPTIQRESDDWVATNGPLRDGQAAVTGGGDLPAPHVVHVAGPIYDRAAGNNEDRLRAAVRAALDTAAGAGARSVAFPAISAGVYGYPLDEATAVLADEVAAFCRQHDGALDEVRLVGFDDTTTDAFAEGVAQATRA